MSWSVTKVLPTVAKPESSDEINSTTAVKEIKHFLYRKQIQQKKNEQKNNYQKEKG